jgi:DNA-binding NarL/FixJ family response regulator
MSEPPKLTRPLRVLVVDDHDVVHWGLRIMLERLSWVQCAYSARDGDEAVAIARANEIDAALVDLFVGSEAGPEVCERLLLARPGLRVLLISGAGEISARAAAGCGASGFVSKGRPGVEIVRALRTVALGSTAFESEEEMPTAPAQLSGREREVIVLMAAGSTNREIAQQLHLSPHTVKEYSSAAYRKLGARNRIDAIKRAEKLGLIA